MQARSILNESKVCQTEEFFQETAQGLASALEKAGVPARVVF